MKQIMRKRKFRVGDRIKLISIPESAINMPPRMRDGVHGTLTAFKTLMKRNRPRRVVEVEAGCGWPWVAFQVLHKGRIHYHKLMIEPECVILVPPSKAIRRKR